MSLSIKKTVRMINPKINMIQAVRYSEFKNKFLFVMRYAISKTGGMKATADGSPNINTGNISAFAFASAEDLMNENCDCVNIAFKAKVIKDFIETGPKGIYFLLSLPRRYNMNRLIVKVLKTG
jgi:hypothetical protein